MQVPLPVEFRIIRYQLLQDDWILRTSPKDFGAIMQLCQPAVPRFRRGESHPVVVLEVRAFDRCSEIIVDNAIHPQVRRIRIGYAGQIGGQ
mgnify:CR=1 FL=1